MWKEMICGRKRREGEGRLFYVEVEVVIFWMWCGGKMIMWRGKKR